MAPNAKANVDKSTTIRAASKNKQRSQNSNRSAPSPLGTSAGGSLASSLSSLFSPQPHGKDAALASLLASSSKPPVNLGQKSGLAAFGTISSSAKPTKSVAPGLSLLDGKQKSVKNTLSRADVNNSVAASSRDNTAAAAAADASSSSKEALQPSTEKEQQQKKQKQSKQDTRHAAAETSKPIVPNVPAGRRPVFRPVLASSTVVNWPEMPVAGSKTILHTLIETLAEAEVQSAVRRDLGRRTRAPSTSGKGKATARAEPEAGPPQVLAGINSITRALEANIASDLAQLHISGDGKEKAKTATSPSSIKAVFVCRHDVPNPALIAHLPMLVTARNAVAHAVNDGLSKQDDSVPLFALPSGSETLLAKALDLRRASILAITSAFSASHLTHVLTAIERETGSICHLRAPWLETALLAAKRSASQSERPALTQQLTTIKLLRTTQPNDLNGCKAEKKGRRKERSVRWKKRKMQMQQSIKSLRAELKHAAKKEREAKKTGDKTGQNSQIVSMDTS